MKLQYKNNQWVESESGIPIAPQDQEKVNLLMWNDHTENIKYEDFKSDPSKLYDSGNLEFELKEFCISEVCENNGACEGCREPKQFWTLKDEKQECLHDNTIQISETERGCENCGEVIDSLVDRFFNDKNFWGYINSKEQRLIIAQCAANIARDEIKQLQNKINSLEEHRENLIAKLMNAEDKLNDLQEKR